MVPLLRRTRTIATCVSKFLAKISYNWWISSTQVWFSTENNMKMQSRILGKRQNHSKPPIPGSCPAIQVAVAGKPVSWSNSRAGTAGFGDLVGNIHFGPNFSVAKVFYFDLLCIFCWVPGFMSVWFFVHSRIDDPNWRSYFWGTAMNQQPARFHPFTGSDVWPPSNPLFFVDLPLLLWVCLGGCSLFCRVWALKPEERQKTYRTEPWLFTNRKYDMNLPS